MMLLYKYWTYAFTTSTISMITRKEDIAQMKEIMNNNIQNFN